jgi:hypothetical protein
MVLQYSISIDLKSTKFNSIKQFGKKILKNKKNINKTHKIEKNT